MSESNRGLPIITRHVSTITDPETQALIAEADVIIAQDYRTDRSAVLYGSAELREVATLVAATEHHSGSL